MELSFFYVADLARVMIADQFDEAHAEKYCPFPGELIRQAECRQQDAELVFATWRHLMVHQQWFIAANQLMAWIRTFDSIVDVPKPNMLHEHNSLCGETIVLFSAAQKHPGINRSYHQLRKYAHVGLERNDKIIKLETIFMPEGEATSVEAFARFIERIQPN